MVIANLAIPLIVNMIVVWYWRGSFGRLPAILLTLLAAAFAVDLFWAFQGGKQAGLFSIILGPPAMLLLLLGALVQKPKIPLESSPAIKVASASAVLAGIVVLIDGLLRSFIGIWTLTTTLALVLSGLICWQNSRRRLTPNEQSISPMDQSRPAERLQPPTRTRTTSIFAEGSVTFGISAILSAIYFYISPNHEIGVVMPFSAKGCIAFSIVGILFGVRSLTVSAGKSRLAYVGLLTCVIPLGYVFVSVRDDIWDGRQQTNQPSPVPNPVDKTFGKSHAV